MNTSLKTTIRATIAVFGFAITSGSVQASVFDHADQMFAQRENNSQNVAAARSEYLSLMTSVTGADLGYAVQQIGRLAVYEGTYLISDDTANNAHKAQIFDQCRTTAARISGQPPLLTIYSYWRLACSALWIRYATGTERLTKLGEVKQEFDDLVDDQLNIRADRAVDLRYEGGGINRVLAGIFGDPLSALIRRGLPNGAKALDMANQALSARAYPGDPNQATDYYSNHRYKAVALRSSLRSADALTELSSAISEIEERDHDGDMPQGIEPETRGELVLLRGLNH